jgi:hypothetical protein
MGQGPEVCFPDPLDWLASFQVPARKDEIRPAVHPDGRLFSLEHRLSLFCFEINGGDGRAEHPEVVGNGARRLRRFSLSTTPRHRMPGRFSHPDAEAG